MEILSSSQFDCNNELICTICPKRPKIPTTFVHLMHETEPKVIDLYSGVGGLSLGAARAGFNVACSVELDIHASTYHAINFPNTIHLTQDVGQLTGKELLEKASLKANELTGLIGGPPCQGFSSIGHRQFLDERNDLFGHFFRLVKESKPVFFVAENVPGILDSRFDEIRQNAFSHVKDNYTLLPPFTVKASLYGAPTIRTRVFFIGYDPKRFSKSLTPSDFLPDPAIDPVVVRAALAGLPDVIDPEWQSEQNSWHTVNVISESSSFGNSVRNNVPVGIGSETALRRLFEKNEVSGFFGTRHTPELIERYGNLKHGEQDRISKSIRLHPDRFCPTLRAGTGSDKGSFQAVRPIHFDHPRVISPREGARLQGFPDWFVFHPTKWHSFRQIGNSVSPIVAEVIMKVIKSCF